MPEKFQPEARKNLEQILSSYLENQIDETKLKNILRSDFKLDDEIIRKIINEANFSKSRRRFLKASIAAVIAALMGIKEAAKSHEQPARKQTLEPASTKKPIPTVTPELTPEIKKVTTKVIYRGPAGTKKVAVTFDDSPSPPLLNQLLTFAKTHKVKLVWFPIGRATSQATIEIIKDGLASGLIRIGNHTMNHRIVLFSSLSDFNQIRKEITSWIKLMSGYGLPESELLRYFRPPGGGGGYRGGNPRLISLLSEIGYPYLCMWDVEFIYTTRVNNLGYNVSNIYSIMTNKIQRRKGGNLVLCHFNETDVTASLKAITDLLNQGYTFVYPEELFA